MTQLDLAGAIDRPLTHLALFGLAAILEDCGIRDVRMHFTDEPTPRGQVTADGESSSEIAESIHEHARSNAADSWVNATRSHEGVAGTGVFSPRLKFGDPNATWPSLQQDRWEALDRLTKDASALDLRMVAGLGEPAYWRITANGVQPDQGASRWEMKTRNRGEEFVGNRLAPLAAAVAARSVGTVLDGLVGHAVVDETASTARDSRTATGFAPPGPTDSVLAWCALWGLSQLPVVHSGGGRSRTPGAQGWDRIHPHVMVLPVFTEPVSPPRLRAILRSSELDRQASELRTSRVSSDSAWLVEHGVRALARFAVMVAGSASAPERRVLDGDIVPLV